MIATHDDRARGAAPVLEPRAELHERGLTLLVAGFVLDDLGRALDQIDELAEALALLVVEATLGERLEGGVILLAGGLALGRLLELVEPVEEGEHAHDRGQTFAGLE